MFGRDGPDFGFIKYQPGKCGPASMCARSSRSREKPIKVVRAQRFKRLIVIAIDPLGKGHDMGLDDFKAVLAVLAAAQKIMLFQFVFMR